MANEKKMIVTDLDGTLLKNDKTISKNTIEAINELRMRGHKFVIATARPLRAAKKFLESVETDAGIYHNGALIYKLHIKEEYERDIKDLPDKILGEQLKDILGMDFPDFYMLGKLETQRKVFYPNRDVEISLDMSTYFGKVDYEIEIEFGKEVPSELLLLLADNGIKPKEKTDGKFARFMSGYLKINK